MYVHPGLIKTFRITARTVYGYYLELFWKLLIFLCVHSFDVSDRVSSFVLRLRCSPLWKFPVHGNIEEVMSISE